MRIDHTFLSRRALPSFVALTLVAGTMPATCAFAENAAGETDGAATSTLCETSSEDTPVATSSSVDATSSFGDETSSSVNATSSFGDETSVATLSGNDAFVAALSYESEESASAISCEDYESVATLASEDDDASSDGDAADDADAADSSDDSGAADSSDDSGAAEATNDSGAAAESASSAPSASSGGTTTRIRTNGTTSTSMSTAAPSSEEPQSDASSEEEKDAEADEEEDPYASTYEATAAEGGESHGSLTYIAGDTAEPAAVAQALRTWDHADTVVLVPVNAGAEVLSAAALAGSLHCPVLFLSSAEADGAQQASNASAGKNAERSDLAHVTLGDATRDAIAQLGATRAIVVSAGSSDVSDAISGLQAIAIPAADTEADTTDAEAAAADAEADATDAGAAAADAGADSTDAGAAAADAEADATDAEAAAADASEDGSASPGDPTDAAGTSSASEAAGGASPQMEVVSIKGHDASATSFAVARYGQDLGLWTLNKPTLANGADVEVARATAGVAYALAQPVLLTDEGGQIATSYLDFFMGNSESVTGVDCVTGLVVLAADDRVADSTVNSFQLMNLTASKRTRVVRLQGASAADVNEHAATWYASNHTVDWANSIICNPAQASCATAGIMATRLGGVQLTCTSDAVTGSLGLVTRTGLSDLVLSGEGNVLDPSTIAGVRARAGIYTVTTVSAGTTLDAAADHEVDLSKSTDGVAQKAKDDILLAMDPGRASRGTAYYYEFALLDRGYSGATTAEQIDAFIDSIAGPYEATYGTTSLLRGTGQAFIDAARESNVNEIYLLAHAIHESACGCSQLAQGSISGAHNFFGISAYDSNPDAGASFASSQGWDSPEAAIKGGAAWIASNYIHSSYGQNTLYLMRFNVPSGSHQYATGLGWNTSTANLMARFYAHAGIALEHTGLDFKVVVYDE